MGIGDAPSELIEAVVRYVRLLDKPRDLAVLAPLVEREILWHVLCSEQGYRLRQIGLADSRLSQIGRAMRWMREHYSELLRVDDLARIAAMSVTSFHRHFRAVALMSPLQYQKPDPAAGGARVAARRRGRRRARRSRGRLRQPVPVQPRVQTRVRFAARSRRARVAHADRRSALIKPADRSRRR